MNVDTVVIDKCNCGAAVDEERLYFMCEYYEIFYIEQFFPNILAKRQQIMDS
jgi:hypothetical protein